MRFHLRTLMIVLALGLPVIDAADRSPAEKITFDELAVLGIKANMVVRDFMLPDRARELDGKRVIVTGYMYPGASQTGIKEFVLLRQKDCPFGVGGQADHVAQTVMCKGVTANFTTSPVKIEATLVIRFFEGPDGNIWSLYRLEEARIR
jgi:hypothetical protein